MQTNYWLIVNEVKRSFFVPGKSLVKTQCYYNRTEYQPTWTGYCSHRTNRFTPCFKYIVSTTTLARGGRWKRYRAYLLGVKMCDLIYTIKYLNKIIYLKYLDIVVNVIFCNCYLHMRVSLRVWKLKWTFRHFLVDFVV